MSSKALTVPGGVYAGKTLAEISADEHGLTWLYTQLKKLPVDDRMRDPIESYVRRQHADLWSKYAAELQHASPRRTNQAERAIRRREIEDRWNERAAIRMFETATDPTERPVPIREVADKLLHFGQWVDYVKLLETLPPGQGEVPNFIKLTRHLLRVIELKEMPYDEYLQSPEWKALAAQAKARYGERCALDDKHSADHAHHRTYARRGRERLDDLVPLCAECHARFHGKSGP